MSLVGYNRRAFVWSYRAKRAFPSNKADGIGFIESIRPQEMHNMLEAGLASLNIANSSSGHRKRMIFLGNRLPRDPEACMATLTASNGRDLPFDVILVSDPHFPSGEEWWRSFAAANSGNFEMTTF